MQCGVYSICRNKMYQEHKGEKQNRNIPLSDFYTRHEVIRYQLKVDCDKFKIYTINCKATRNITKQRVIANKEQMR